MLFVEGTWGTVDEGVRKQMAKGKVEKLRKLTVLALFEGMHVLISCYSVIGGTTGDHMHGHRHHAVGNH